MYTISMAAASALNAKLYFAVPYSSIYRMQGIISSTRRGVLDTLPGCNLVTGYLLSNIVIAWIEFLLVISRVIPYMQICYRDMRSKLVAFDKRDEQLPCSEPAVFVYDNVPVKVRFSNCSTVFRH
jgi:hypothetical protein